MLKVINTKLLIAIVALLTTIAGLLAYQRAENKRAADAAVKAALILKQQQDVDQAKRDHEAALWKQVEENKKKHSSLNKGSKVWKTYLP